MVEFIIQVIGFFAALLLAFMFYFILSFPGAFIRWLFLKSKRTYKEILKDDIYINSSVALFVLGPILVIILAIILHK